MPPFSKPSALPRAEALREVPKDTLDSARKCWCCQRDDLLARLEVDGTASAREHLPSPSTTKTASRGGRSTPAGRSEILLQTEAQKLLQIPAAKQRGKAMERLATSKLRSELHWGAPPLSELRPSTKHLISPSAQLTHRLEGIVWALEQKVTRQYYEIGTLKAGAKDQDYTLQSSLAEAARNTAEADAMRGALREAEDSIERLTMRAEEAEASVAEALATIATLQEKLASKKNKAKDLGGKSNREQMEEISQEAKDNLEKKVNTPKEAAADFEKRWKDHVNKGGLKVTGCGGPGASASPRTLHASRIPHPTSSPRQQAQPNR